jgi:hypothetical protein
LGRARRLPHPTAHDSLRYCDSAELYTFANASLTGSSTKNLLASRISSIRANNRLFSAAKSDTIFAHELKFKSF